MHSIAIIPKVLLDSDALGSFTFFLNYFLFVYDNLKAILLFRAELGSWQNLGAGLVGEVAPQAGSGIWGQSDPAGGEQLLHQGDAHAQV